MKTYKYEIEKTKGSIEARNYEEAMSQVITQLNIEITETNKTEELITEIVQKYLNHSTTFLEIIMDWEIEENKIENTIKEIQKIANALIGEYEEYIMEKVYTEKDDVTTIKNYKTWEEEKLNKLMKITNKYTGIEFSKWIRENY